MTLILRRTVLVAVLGGVLTLFFGGNASASHLCNQTITSSGIYTLPHNHICPAGTAFTIDADNVTLDLNGYQIAGLGTAVVGIRITGGSDSVTIRNGTVRGFDRGIEAGDCAPGFDTTLLRIEDVVVRNSGTYGINLCPQGGDMEVFQARVIGTGVFGTGINGDAIDSAGSVTVERSLVRDAPAGVSLRTMQGGEGVVMETAVVDASLTAVSLPGGGFAGFTDGRVACTLGAGACGVGVQVSAAESPVIARNRISGVQVGVRAIPHAPGVQGVRIEDNQITSLFSVLRAVGIEVEDRAGSLIGSNTVRNVTAGPAASATGIHLACSNTTVIEGNTVAVVEGDGIVMDDVNSLGGCTLFTTSTNHVHDNLVRNADGNGLVVAAGPQHLVSGNTAWRSGLDGFLVGAGVSATTLTDNRAGRSGGDGFQLDTGALTLAGNVARQNGGWGFLTVAPLTDLGGNQAVQNALGSCNPAHLTC